MSKPEWGTKRGCPKCSANFYDLNKNPAHCPKCGHSFDPEQVLKKKNRRKSASPLNLLDEKAALVAQKKKIAITGEDEETLDLPEFEDLDIIEDIDDMEDVGEEVGGMKAKPAGTADEEDDEEEGFLDDEEDDLLDDELILAEEPLDEDEEEDDK